MQMPYCVNLFNWNCEAAWEFSGINTVWSYSVILHNSFVDCLQSNYDFSLQINVVE